MTDDGFSDWNPMVAFFETPAGRKYLAETDAILADLDWIEARPVHCLDELFPEPAEKNSNPSGGC